MRWVKGLRDLNYDDRLKGLKFLSPEKKDKKRLAGVCIRTIYVKTLSPAMS